MTPRTESGIRSTIRRIVYERLGEEVDESADLLEVAGLSSLEFVELLVEIEEEFDTVIDFVSIDPETLLSVNGLVRHIRTLGKDGYGA